PGHQPPGRRHAQRRLRCPAPGLTLPATFTGSSDIAGGTPSQLTGGARLPLQGTRDQGPPLYPASSPPGEQGPPPTLNASGGTDLGGTVGQAFAQDFFLSGGAGPYVWSVASGQLPPGLSLRTFAGPRDANDELAGTPTAAGTFTFTMQLTDYTGAH